MNSRICLRSGPVGIEFRMVSDKMKIGRTMEAALQDTADRMGTAEFQFFVITLAIQRETGGNLAETLSNLADVLRKRSQMKLKIKAMSSESKASAYIIGCLPFVVFTLVWFINPNYMGNFFVDGIVKAPAAIPHIVFALALVVMMIGLDLSARKEQVFTGYYKYDSNRRGEASFVTDEFEVKGHTSNVDLTTSTDLNNRWIYLNYALINETTGQAFDFAREVSYYHGYDSDGSWSEGSVNDSVAVPKVPPGRYYLRVEPEGDPGYGVTYYTIAVKRDVPQYSFYGIALGALFLPVLALTWRSLSFEHLRWAESDHAPLSSGDDE